MYKVIKFFTDLQDNNHPYKAGDVFPRKGLDVTDERLAELSSHNNKRHIPLIEKVEDEVTEVAEEKAVNEPVNDFMNPPVIDETPAEETVVEETPKKKRGRPRVNE